ncbi:MAG: hypothetical protein Q8K65_06210 [Alphaproteobacteria bacterium]|nr:hypothetical protein [Alphaproteobacteria bacterium]
MTPREKFKKESLVYKYLHEAEGNDAAEEYIDRCCGIYSTALAKAFEDVMAANPWNVSPYDLEKIKKAKNLYDEPTRAILFSLTICDHHEARSFLEGWTQGDTSEWPEFATFNPDNLPF